MVRHQVAMEHYEKFIQREVVSQWYDKWWATCTWALKGNALSNMKRYDEAIDCYDKAFKIISDYPAAILFYKNIALLNDECFKRINSISQLDIKVIMRIVDKYLVNSPTNVYLLTLKGNILANLGKQDEAIQCYDKALEIKPDCGIVEYSRN